MGILEEQDKILNKKREAQGKSPIQRDYSVLEIGGQSLNDLMKKAEKMGIIGQAIVEASRLEEEIDKAKSERDMAKLEDLMGLQAEDMNVSNVSQNVIEEARAKAEEAKEEVTEAEERGSGGLTLEEIPLDKEKWKEIFSKTDDEPGIDEK